MCVAVAEVHDGGDGEVLLLLGEDCLPDIRSAGSDGFHQSDREGCQGDSQD